MATKFTYSETVSNTYLGLTKVIKAQSRWELNLKVREQCAKWDVQAQRKRERDKNSAERARARDQVANLKELAERLNLQAEQEHECYANLLASTLKVNDALDWRRMRQTEHFREFAYTEKEPILALFNRKHGVPKKKFIEGLIRPIRNKRLRLEEAAKSEYEQALTKYNESKKMAESFYEAQKMEFLKKQQEHNEDIDQWKERFEQGDGLAIEKYMRVVLANSRYPDAISADSEVSYDVLTKTAIVDFSMPMPDDIPDAVGYKYVASRKAIDPVMMKSKDKAALYEQVILQIALRTIHELFEGVYMKELLEGVVFNGWVNGVNKATGLDYSACILSVRAGREVFEQMNLARVEPKECMRELKMLSAGPLANLAPVKPIMELNREDKRFVPSVDVMDAMGADTNLATMPWEDFEHLVRELFGRIFSRDGAEVRVTQASRDGGVDAIAFDPDPIRGGKYVIQAKRYNNVVSVSACRDLYGTMINEGAVKGILVTTSYFGGDSREFTKDKPITLIDGANLVYMLNEYGYDFRIGLKEHA